MLIDSAILARHSSSVIMDLYNLLILFYNYHIFYRVCVILVRSGMEVVQTKAEHLTRFHFQQK